MAVRLLLRRATQEMAASVALFTTSATLDNMNELEIFFDYV